MKYPPALLTMVMGQVKSAFHVTVSSVVLRILWHFNFLPGKKRGLLGASGVIFGRIVGLLSTNEI